MKNIILNSIISGFLIGTGCIINLSCGDNKVLGAFLFSLGLIVVIIQQRWLFTGKIGYLKNLEDAKNFTVCLIVNLFSIGLFTYGMKTLGQLPIDASAICSAKVNEEWYEGLTRGIGCGMLMFIGVDGYKRTKNMLVVVMPVMVFILCGFDHCIANYGYLTMENIWFTPQLVFWIIGNAIGSLIISKIGLSETDH